MNRKCTALLRSCVSQHTGNISSGPLLTTATNELSDMHYELVVAWLVSQSCACSASRVVKLLQFGSLVQCKAVTERYCESLSHCKCQATPGACGTSRLTCMKATQRQSRLGTEMRSSSRRLCRCQMRISPSPQAAKTSLYWYGKATSCTLLGGAVCSISACSFLLCTALLSCFQHHKTCCQSVCYSIET